MADHRQEIVSRGLRFIGPCPFDPQPEVGILSLEREQARKGEVPLPALLSGRRILSPAVRRQRRILAGALVAKTLSLLARDPLVGELLVLPIAHR